MTSRKKLFKRTLLLLFLVAFVGLACEISDVIPGNGTPGVLPTQEPSEPTSPPVEPTSPPVEPTSPPVEPTQPPVESTSPPEVVPTAPPEGGGDDSSESLLQVLFWLLVIVVVILGIALIVSLFTGRRKEPTSQVVETPPDKPPAYAEIVEEPQQPEPVPVTAPQSALDNLTPAVAPLYDRFVNMLQALGPVTILPTQTRVDFQRRIIFTSVQFSQEDMRVQLLLPHRVDDPRMVRMEVFSEDKISHTLVIRSVDEFDVQFSSWLQEAYNLGG